MVLENTDNAEQHSSKLKGWPLYNFYHYQFLNQ